LWISDLGTSDVKTTSVGKSTFMIFEQLPKPILFAHRGASAYAPENTLAAFELAIRQEAPAIELDAKLSLDGKVVVIHDQTVDRTTSQHGKVNQFTLQRLREMDAGSHFDVAFRGEPVPSLEDVFAAVGQRLYINVELTNYASLNDDLPEKVAELVKEYKLEQRVLFSSFNPIALQRVRRQLPETPISLLAFPGWKGALARGWPGRLLNYQALHPNVADTTPSLVQETHRRGCRLVPWTVNQPEEMRRLFQMGVDGIFTDDPVQARQVLNSLDQPAEI
jgi:glycerophosphoryl diester phosphodiesterase